MELIKRKFHDKALPLAKEVKEIKEKYGDTAIDQVTVNQLLTGMKGVVSLLTCTSKLDPHEGIRFRGYSIPEIQRELPRRNPQGEPLPEGLFYLMLVNELPTQEIVDDLSIDWSTRAAVPQHVFDVIDALPKTSRPMTQFSAAILAMATDSLFQKAYRAGVSKKDYWDTTYEDVMNLIARLPRVASYIYRRLYHNGQQIDADPQLDWAGNFAHMMGFDSEEVKRLFRLYLTIHADHEGGNVSAHTTHLVGSALSNPYYAFSAAMTGLAGPLHGLANQEVIRWIFDMLDQIGSEEPTKQQIEDFVKKTLSEGRVIPGYGHAVLRKPDPRYMAQREFAQKYLSDYYLFKVVNSLYEVVPPILSSLGKVKNPWPNVDAHSGILLYYYGITEYDFYTVMFGVSRALGVLASLVWDRAYGLPIERPKSQNLPWLREKLGLNKPE